MQREREEWEEFLQLRKSRFLISHGLKMTTPCLSSKPPSTPSPLPHKLQLVEPAVDHIFLPHNPSTDLSEEPMFAQARQVCTAFEAEYNPGGLE